MTDERSKTQRGEGRASSQSTTAEVLQGALRSSVSPPSRGTEKTVARGPTPTPAPEPLTLAQMLEAEKPCRKPMAQQTLLGVMATVLSTAVLLNCLVPTPSTGGSNGARSTVSLPLAFATFLCGNALMLFSLPRSLISGGQRVASRCLAVGCVSLSTLTSLSLLWALPCKHYPYVGHAVAVVVILPVVAPMKWRHRTEGDDEAAAYEEDKDDLKDAFKTASGVTIIAVGCLLGAVFGASDHSGTSPETKTAVLFTFCTAILGLFLTVLSKTKVLDINDQRRRGGIIRAIRFGNAVLLCFLSLAAFAVLRYGVFAAFAPPAVLYFLL